MLNYSQITGSVLNYSLILSINIISQYYAIFQLLHNNFSPIWQRIEACYNRQKYSTCVSYYCIIVVSAAVVVVLAVFVVIGLVVEAKSDDNVMEM